MGARGQPAWVVLVTSPERRAGRAWRKLREQVLAGDPVCAICRLRPATTADHVVPVTLGGAEMDLSNLRPACAPCNFAGGALITNARRRSRYAGRAVGYPPEAWLVRPGDLCPYHDTLCGRLGHLRVGWS